MRLNSLLIPLIILFIVATTTSGYIFFYKDTSETRVSPMARLTNMAQSENKEDKDLKYTSDLSNNDTINILLLGIDRRSKAEFGYRTDTMILLSVNKNTNRVLLTSLPRDLWYGSGRLNALYVAEGWEGLQTAFAEITGIRPQRYILTDFEDFSWIVDALGGVTVDIETSFTDMQYPVDATLEYQTVTFAKGPETLTGERALIFARSRKGDFDNGDWGRMKRQHLMLKGMVNAAVQPKSFICNFTKQPFKTSNSTCESYIDVETLGKALTTVTTGKMETNLNISDLTYLWDFYKDKDHYAMESLLMDYDYVYTPPMEEYGGAWVLAPIGGSYLNFQTTLKNMLAGIPEQEVKQTQAQVQLTTPPAQ